MQNLAQVLVDFDIVHLRAIARQRGVELESLVHRDVVDQLVPALMEPAHIKRALKAMSDAEREALATLQRAGGKQRAHLFLHEHGSIRRYGPARMEREEPWLSPASPAEALWYLGFLGRAFARVEDETPEFVFIPTDLIPLLPAPDPEPPTSEKPQPSTEIAPVRIDASNAGIVTDLYEMLLHIQLHRPRAVESALPDMDAWRQRLGEECPDEYLEFIYHLGRQIGLVEIESGRLRLTPDRARDWLDRPAIWQWRSLMNAWKDDAEWNDLWRVPGIHCDRAGWENDPIRSRERFLAQLQAVPAREWLLIVDLTRQIKSSDPDFQRPSGDYNSWYIRDAESDELLVGFEHWDTIEGALITHYLCRPLHWLGMIDLGYDEEGEDVPALFRITPAGEQFLSNSEIESIEKTATPIEVNEELVIRLAQDATLYYRLQIERFTERVSEENVFQITPRSLLTARSQNIQPPAITNFLERASTSPLPANCQEKIRERWHAVDQIRMRRLVTLDFSEPAVLDWLQKDPERKHLLGEIVSPTRARLPESQLTRLLKRLRRLGLNPEVTQPPEN